LFFLIASWIHKGWAWLLAIVLVVLMGLSRIYLGDHFIIDVIGGLTIGLVILLGIFFWRRYFATSFGKRILGQRLLFALLITLILVLGYVAVLILIGEPDLSVAWAAHFPVAELDSKMEMATAVGALVGYTVGIILEGARIRFRADGPIVKRIARYLLGIIITVIIWRGLGMLFPDDPLWLALPLRILRYALVALWASYYAPALFVRLQLADGDPDPGINLKM
jgi:hypothetical protein